MPGVEKAFRVAEAKNETNKLHEKDPVTPNASWRMSTNQHGGSTQASWFGKTQNVNCSD